MLTATNIFKTQSRNFKRLLTATHKNPTKRNIHQLRILIRKLSASLWLADNGSHKYRSPTLLSDLRSLNQALGKVREVDVAIQDANLFNVKSKSLRKKREVACARFLKVTKRHKRTENIRHLNKAVRKIEIKKSLNIDRSLRQLREHLLQWTNKTEFSKKDFHKIRILVKRTRYTFETIGRATDRLHKLQGVLGRCHDLEVLKRFSKPNSGMKKALHLEREKAQKMIYPVLRSAITQINSYLAAPREIPKRSS